MVDRLPGGRGSPRCLKIDTLETFDGDVARRLILHAFQAYGNQPRVAAYGKCLSDVERWALLSARPGVHTRSCGGVVSERFAEGGGEAASQLRLPGRATPTPRFSSSRP